MYVENSFNHQSASNNPIFILRGQGFSGFVSEFAEDTYIGWSDFFEHTIYINSLDKDIKEIEIISEEEYNEAFEKLLLEIKQEHYNYLKK